MPTTLPALTSTTAGGASDLVAALAIGVAASMGRALVVELAGEHRGAWATCLMHRWDLLLRSTGRSWIPVAVARELGLTGDTDVELMHHVIADTEGNRVAEVRALARFAFGGWGHSIRLAPVVGLSRGHGDVAMSVEMPGAGRAFVDVHWASSSNLAA